MRIDSILKRKQTLSFEIYPPKPELSLDGLQDTLTHLYALLPDFISCTYGAAGTNHDRNTEVCRRITRDRKSPLLAHYTCIGSTRESICAQMEQYRSMGIESILALRGDFPKGYVGTQGDFDHADALLTYLMEHFPEFCYGVACYPETHVRAVSPGDDLQHLLDKQSMGASFCISQLCFDADVLLRFRDRAHKAGLRIPMVIGVLPALNAARARDMAVSNGCCVPKALATLMDRYALEPDAFRAAGIAYTARLIDRLRMDGVDGVHLYTMNGYRSVEAIFHLCAAWK